jgi:formiminotetrahydrofolate cyclodeaminase
MPDSIWPDSIWEDSLASFGSRLAEPQPMPAGVAAASVTASLGLALFLKVVAIASKRQPIPGLATVAKRHLLDLESVIARDTAAFERYRQAGPNEKKLAAAEAVTIPLRAAHATAGGLELCSEALQQVDGWIAADLRAAAALLHGALKALLACVNANLARLPLEDDARTEMLLESAATLKQADAAYARIETPWE